MAGLVGEEGEGVGDAGGEEVGDGAVRQRMARTSGLKRRLSQTGQGTKTSERNCISTRS
jgi:hypothetical protein